MGLLDNRVGFLLTGLCRWLPGAYGKRKDTEYYRLKRSFAPKVAGPAFEACMSRLGPGHTVIDLGANLGEITTRLARTGARVHAFEPDPWTHSRLAAAVAGYDNVTLHQTAVGGHDGEVLFRRDPGFVGDRESRSEGGSVYESVLWEGGREESFSVRLVDFVRFLEELDSDVELVKMDIEGAEVDVLEKLIDAPVFGRIGHLFVETHEWQIPEIRPRLRRLRTRMAGIARPEIYLDWH